MVLDMGRALNNHLIVKLDKNVIIVEKQLRKAKVLLKATAEERNCGFRK